MIDNSAELNEAGNALQDWFRSQGLDPHEAILVISYFVAKMIIVNIDSSSAETKLAIHVDTIKELIEVLK